MRCVHERGEKVDSLIYQFIQEGLTNSFRHGEATKIKILFWREDHILNIHLTDNGIGAKSIKEGIGMMGMRERLGALGGTMDSQNVVDGFELSARIPVKELK